MHNHFKQYFSHLSNDFSIVHQIETLLDCGYKISEITDALDVEDSDVVKVIDNYVSNKMKWVLYERFMEKYYDEKDIKRSEAKTLFG